MRSVSSPKPDIVLVKAVSAEVVMVKVSVGATPITRVFESSPDRVLVNAA
jgi:hypothetical protein